MTTPYIVRRMAQGSRPWLEYRRTHIGSSDAPVIVGESPYRGPLDLYAEKIGPPEEPDPMTARLFRIGHHMEPLILEMYAEETGRKVRPGRVLESREMPWLFASLDGEYKDRIVEAKWTSSSRWGDGVPDDVVVQVTHQMAVRGARVADVAVLRGRDFQVHTIPFDESLWYGILGMEQDFLGTLRRREPPEPGPTEADRRAIARLHPEDNGEMIVADSALETLVHLWLAERVAAKATAEAVESLENSIRFALGDNTGAVGSDFQVTYRKNKDSERVAWKDLAGSLESIISEAAPDRLDEVQTLRGLYTTVTPGPRVLRVKQEDKG